MHRLRDLARLVTIRHDCTVGIVIAPKETIGDLEPSEALLSNELHSQMTKGARVCDEHTPRIFYHLHEPSVDLGIGVGPLLPSLLVK